MFSGAHLHLLSNHVPIFGCVFALGLLIVSFLTSADTFRRTAFVILVLTAVAGVVANRSGEPAEDAIRGFPGVRREVIHAHEEMAKRAYLLAGALGILALGGLVCWRKKSVPSSAAAVAVLATAFVTGAMIYTALLGGRVRHTEVRPGALESDALIIEPPRKRPAEAGK